MSGFYKVNGSWKGVSRIYAKVEGIWEGVIEGYQKVNSEWVKVFAYSLISYAGVQIGQAIITPENIWTDNEGTHVFDLLLADGSSFNAESYPILSTKYPSLILPNLPIEVGSPFPYKIVADYTGGT